MSDFFMECWPTFHPPSLLSNSGPMLNIPFIQEAFPDSRAGPGPPLGFPNLSVTAWITWGGNYTCVCPFLWIVNSLRPEMRSYPDAGTWLMLDTEEVCNMFVEWMNEWVLQSLQESQYCKSLPAYTWNLGMQRNKVTLEDQPLGNCKVSPYPSRWLSGIESTCNVGDPGSVPGLGRSPGEGNGNPLQYSCLDNPMDRGALWAIVHGVAKSQTRLNYWAYTHCLENSWYPQGLSPL